MIRIACTNDTWGDTMPLTREWLRNAIQGKRMANIIYQIRNGYPIKKKELPAVCWQAEGYDGNKRTDENAHLNGLFALDIDHVPGAVVCGAPHLYRQEPDAVEELAKEFVRRADELDIVCVHRSPSGDGLHVVALCQPEFQTIAQNQRWLARALDTPYDDKCCDMARMMFLSVENDFYYLDEETLFDMEENASEEAGKENTDEKD